MDPFEAFGLRFVNVVLTARLEHGVDTARLAAILPGARPERRRPTTIVFRQGEPRSTLLIIKSGKLIFMAPGRPSVVQTLFKAAIALVESVAGPLPHLASRPRIVNIVATFGLEEQIDLNKMTRMAMTDAIDFDYEPEIFPGAILHPLGDSVTLLLYNSGNGVISGAKDEGEIRDVLEWLMSTLVTPV